MAVSSTFVKLPIRAKLWIIELAKRRKCPVNHVAGEILLRGLHHTPGVDLSRSPESFKQGGSHVESSSESRGEGGSGKG